MTTEDKFFGYAGFGSSFLLGIGSLQSAAESSGLVGRTILRETAFNGPYDAYVLLAVGVVFVLTSVMALATISR